jgi:hypothetical protein
MIENLDSAAVETSAGQGTTESRYCCADWPCSISASETAFRENLPTASVSSRAAFLRAASEFGGRPEPPPVLAHPAKQIVVKAETSATERVDIGRIAPTVR